MADVEQLAILKKGPETWNKWRQNQRGKYSTFDLTNSDLGSLYLASVNLRHTYLTGANLAQTDLRGADLTEARVGNASLSRANLNNANLSRAILSNSDFSHATMMSSLLISCDCRSANLQIVDLTFARLREANLERADLSHANLYCTDFTRADLKNAQLCGANFIRSDLIGVDLAGANLSRANLKYAAIRSSIVDKAVFSYSIFGETIISDLDMNACSGLDEVNHTGPSNIDYRTIERFQSTPTKFLHGIGVPDVLIQQMPTLLKQAGKFYSCFISYNHSDNAFSHHLHDRLQHRGIRCWLDEHQLLPGDDIYDRSTAASASGTRCSSAARGTL
jgi:uncharacterized protein YjbI with pentapeptide repeats